MTIRDKQPSSAADAWRVHLRWWLVTAIFGQKHHVQEQRNGTSLRFPHLTLTPGSVHGLRSPLMRQVLRLIAQALSDSWSAPQGPGC